MVLEKQIKQKLNKQMVMLMMNKNVIKIFQYFMMLLMLFGLKWVDILGKKNIFKLKFFTISLIFRWPSLVIHDPNDPSGYFTKVSGMY
jgi:hypothetical protein